jgi:YHS domain-containing protein
MDTEALKSLVWFLVWGGLFFVMMRYGCGAHIGGHRHGSPAKRESGSGETARDPVCGMSVDPPRAAAAAVHGGKTYYFCSVSCREKFEQAPQTFASKSGTVGQQHGGHHHA